MNFNQNNNQNQNNQNQQNQNNRQNQQNNQQQHQKLHQLLIHIQLDNVLGVRNHWLHGLVIIGVMLKTGLLVRKQLVTQ